jgi:hypothetical protein
MNATTNHDGVLWREVDDQVLAIEAALTRPPRPLALVTDRRPGAYLLVYAGPLPMYRRLRPQAVGGIARRW